MAVRFDDSKRLLSFYPSTARISPPHRLLDQVEEVWSTNYADVELGCTIMCKASRLFDLACTEYGFVQAPCVMLCAFFSLESFRSHDGTLKPGYRQVWSSVGSLGPGAGCKNRPGALSITSRIHGQSSGLTNHAVIMQAD